MNIPSFDEHSWCSRIKSHLVALERGVGDPIVFGHGVECEGRLKGRDRRWEF